MLAVEPRGLDGAEEELFGSLSIFVVVVVVGVWIQSILE